MTRSVFLHENKIVSNTGHTALSAPTNTEDLELFVRQILQKKMKMWGSGFTLADGTQKYRDRSTKHARRRSSVPSDASPVDSPVHAPSSAGSSFRLKPPPDASGRISHTPIGVASSGDHGTGQGAVNFYNTVVASPSEDDDMQAEEGSSQDVQVSRDIQDYLKRLKVLAHRPPHLMPLQADLMPSSPSSASASASASALLEESLAGSRKKSLPPPRCVARALSSDSCVSMASSTGSPREPRVLSVTPVNSKSGSRSSTPSSPPQPLFAQDAPRPPPLQLIGLLPSPSSSIERSADMDPQASERRGTAMVDRRASAPLIFNSRPHFSPDTPPASPSTPIVCSRATAAESSLNGSPRSCPRTPRVLSVTPVNDRRRSFRSLDFASSSRASFSSSSLSPHAGGTLGSPSHGDLICV